MRRVEKLNYNRLIIMPYRKCTTENTVFFTKKCAENLQVKNPHIRFVGESQIP
jgi:hypothetical protein